MDFSWIRARNFVRGLCVKANARSGPKEFVQERTRKTDTLCANFAARLTWPYVMWQSVC